VRLGPSTPSDYVRARVLVPRNPGVTWTPRCGVRATHSRVPGFWDKECLGLNQGQAGVRSRHVSGPYRIRFCSPLRRSPNAATWHGVRDVSQKTGPDVRPLDCMVSAFIVDKPRRLSIPLAGDVPPQHLMSHVHSSGRRCAASAFNETCPFRGRQQPVHSVGGVPVHSTGRQYAHAAMCTTPIITRTLRRKQPQHINTAWTTDNIAPENCSGVTRISYSYSVLLPFYSWAHMSGLSILVCAPLSYKREGT
jgi:hypothetical protein